MRERERLGSGHRFVKQTLSHSFHIVISTPTLCVYVHTFPGAAFTSAPCASRASAASTWPMTLAYISAENPSSVYSFNEAPDFSRSLTRAASPVTHEVYSQHLSAYWSHVRYIPSSCHPIGHAEGVFPVGALVLAHLRRPRPSAGPSAAGNDRAEQRASSTSLLAR